MATTFSPAEFALRRATSADLPFLQLMLYEAANRPGEEWPPLDESMNEPRNQRFWTGWARPGDLGIVAEVASRPIGAAWARQFTAEERSPIDHADAVVLAIGVEAPFRGQRIGDRMMSALIDQAEADGVVAIELTTGLFNTAAVQLYIRHGFIETRRRDDAIQMRLDLPKPRP